MELRTQRLLIRSFEADDIPRYVEVISDPEVLRHLVDEPDDAAAHAYVEDCIARGRASGISRYAVLRRRDGAFLGFCGFKALREDRGGRHQSPARSAPSVQHP